MGKREYLIFLGMVFELVSLVVSLVYAGHYLDQNKGLGGFGVISGAILAIAIWVIHLIRVFKPKD